jgi:hypothetical protein
LGVFIMAISQSGDQQRYNRRLSDKIHAAFNHACDEQEAVVATELLKILEQLLLREAPHLDRREAALTILLPSHERLWTLKQFGKARESLPALAGVAA